MSVLRLAIPSPLRALFDYLPPDGLSPEEFAAYHALAISVSQHVIDKREAFLPGSTADAEDLHEDFVTGCKAAAKGYAARVSTKVVLSDLEPSARSKVAKTTLHGPNQIAVAIDELPLRTWSAAMIELCVFFAGFSNVIEKIIRPGEF